MRSWPTVSLPKVVGEPLPLRLFDTGSGKCREIGNDTGTTMYVCGITPYDATHIGHAATYTAFDVIFRNLRESGTPVSYAQNITDVDDPLLERASAIGAEWRELAADQINLFRSDMTELRVLPPTDFVAVTDSIGEIARKVQELVAAGAAYQVGEDWYFDVTSDPDFGEVSHLGSADQLALFAERGGDPDRPGKRHPLDSLLWRGEREGEPSWPSELGAGRPGWHIECVSIAVDRLGDTIDIQGGGSDLAFPHHEMSASHAEVLTGKHPFAKAYVHAGLVSYQGEKMSKSRGNLVFVSQLIASGVDPMAIRLALLANHYRQEWEWTDELLEQSTRRLERLRWAVAQPSGPAADETVARIRLALSNDLDCPAALGALDDWARNQREVGGISETSPGVISRAVDTLLGVAL